jgi:hypothetical protein
MYPAPEHHAVVVGWFGVTNSAFYGEVRRGFSYGEMSGVINFYLTNKFSQNVSSPENHSVLLLLLAFITLH